MLKAILFDLDGTLLPMDQDHYLSMYFKHLAAYMTRRGYELRAFIDNLIAGTYKMLKNDGSKTNEEVFRNHIASAFGEKARNDRDFVDSFYISRNA